MVVLRKDFHGPVATNEVRSKRHPPQSSPRSSDTATATDIFDGIFGRSDSSTASCQFDFSTNQRDPFSEIIGRPPRQATESTKTLVKSQWEDPEIVTGRLLQVNKWDSPQQRRRIVCVILVSLEQENSFRTFLVQNQTLQHKLTLLVGKTVSVRVARKLGWEYGHITNVEQV